MAWSAPSTRSTGDLITAAIWNQDVVDNPAFLGALKRDGVALSALSGGADLSFFHGARANRTTSLTVPTSPTITPVTLGGEDWDQPNGGGSAMHDISTNSERMIMRDAGVYAIFGLVKWDTNTTGNRRLQLVLNGNSTGTAGTAIDEDYKSASAGNITQKVATLWRASASDYVQMDLWQDMGSNRTIASAHLAVHKFARSTA